MESYLRSAASAHSYVALQHASVEDLLWMGGAVPNIKSTVVSVFSFTLLGACVQPCLGADSGVPGPFLSFLRVNDDIDSLYRRFEELMGPTDWSQCRLALVVGKKPMFLPRSTNTAADPLKRLPLTSGSISTQDSGTDEGNERTHALALLVIHNMHVFTGSIYHVRRRVFRM